MLGSMFVIQYSRFWGEVMLFLFSIIHAYGNFFIFVIKGGILAVARLLPKKISQLAILLITTQMSRSESMFPATHRQNQFRKPPNPSPSIASKVQQSNVVQQRPPSERSVDESVRSHYAMEGSSLRGSIASVHSGFSGPSRKSEKSLISNFPEPVKKSMPSIHPTPSIAPSQSSVKNLSIAPSISPSIPVQQKSQKKPSSSFYIEEDYFYSSEFKRNFVKGMLALAKNKSITDISLLLKQVAPTIMVRPNDTSVWVSAYMIIFKIQHQLRRIRFNSRNVLHLIEDAMVQFLLENKDIRKARLLKILIYVFRELPVAKPKTVEWLCDFIGRNRGRLIGVDIGRFVDVFTLNPCPIDYTAIGKSQAMKIKKSDKEKDLQKRKTLEKDEKDVIVLEQAEQPVQIETKTKITPKPLLQKPKQIEKQKQKPKQDKGTQPKLSLQEMISRRIESNMPKPKNIKPDSVPKIMPAQVAVVENIPKEAPIQTKPVQPHAQPKENLAHKIKQLAKNRHQELKAQPQKTPQFIPEPQPSYQDQNNNAGQVRVISSRDQPQFDDQDFSFTSMPEDEPY